MNSNIWRTIFFFQKQNLDGLSLLRWDLWHLKLQLPSFLLLKTGKQTGKKGSCHKELMCIMWTEVETAPLFWTYLHFAYILSCDDKVWFIYWCNSCFGVAVSIGINYQCTEESFASKIKLINLDFNQVIKHSFILIQLVTNLRTSNLLPPCNQKFT